MIGIINYGAGNIFSLTAALDRLNINYRIIDSIRSFNDCGRFIIPGVGHAGIAMKKLQKTNVSGLILQTKKPVLGICVGMQLLTAYSEEGNAPMLGITPMHTRLFDSKSGIKVPHIGWNNVSVMNAHTLFRNISPLEEFYFVHSYYVEADTDTSTIATTDYGIRFSAAIQKDNFFGVQFHPEKSGSAGERILVNFNEI